MILKTNKRTAKIKKDFVKCKQTSSKSVYLSLEEQLRPSRTWFVTSSWSKNLLTNRRMQCIFQPGVNWLNWKKINKNIKIRPFLEKTGWLFSVLHWNLELTLTNGPVSMSVREDGRHLDPNPVKIHLLRRPRITQNF